MSFPFLQPYVGLSGGVQTKNSGGFSPSSVTGLKLWLKSDVGVTKDGSNLVSNWADQSGNGNDVAQATGTKQPLWVDNQHNAKPTIRFDGIDNFMQKATYASGDLAQTNFIFIVSTFPSSSGRYIYDSASHDKRHAFLRNATGYQIYSGSGIATGTGITTALQQFTAKYNGGSSYLRKNGSEIVSGNIGTDSMAGITLGASHEAGNFGNIDICEILVYNASVSDTDRDTIESYLDTRWGL